MSSPTVASIFYLNPRKYGSMEEYSVFLSQALRERGWSSVLAFSAAPNESVLERMRAADPTIEVVDNPAAPANFLALFRLLRKHRPDIVHYHFCTPFSPLPVITRLAGVKAVVFTEHTRLPKTLSPAFRTALVAWDRLVLGPLRIRLFGVSEHVTGIMASCYGLSPKRTRTVHNGVNLARFARADEATRAAVRAEFDLPVDAKLVVCAAYLTQNKGVGDLLRAMATVAAADPRACCLVVGDGPTADALRTLAASLGIAGRVRFAGLRSDVHRLMGAADVVVVPSVLQEPAGLVAVEAMATERPVVATRVGGLKELVEDGVTGRVVEAGAPDQLAQALIQILQSPELAARFGSAGRARAERLFSMQRWIADTLAVYDEALGKS